MNEHPAFPNRRKLWLSVSVMIAVLLLTLSCSIGISASTKTPTPQPTNTQMPSPTATAIPPTSTPMPTEVPKITLGEFEQTLKDAGYTSVVSSDGSFTIWTLDNPFENIYVNNDGEVKIDVLNSMKARLDHMELRFQMMDSLFPSDFMAQLRADNLDYAKTVGAGVTGKASTPYGPVPGDELKYLSAFYNISHDTIGTYTVQFALFFQQWTCPEGYVCWFPNFGGQKFTGQGSFVFYEVAVWLGQ